MKEDFEDKRYLFETTGISRVAVKAWLEGLNDIGLIRVSPNNAKHISLSFPMEITHGRSDNAIFRYMREAVEDLTAELADLAGLPLPRIATAGLMLLRPVPHCHLIAVSQKDRTTGHSVGGLPATKVRELLRWWHQREGNTAELSAVWGIDGLLGYLAGWENAMRPNQRWRALPVVNPQIVRRIATRRDKRERPRCPA